MRLEARRDIAQAAHIAVIERDPPPVVPNVLVGHPAQSVQRDDNARIMGLRRIRLPLEPRLQAGVQDSIKFAGIHAQRTRRSHPELQIWGGIGGII